MPGPAVLNQSITDRICGSSLLSHSQRKCQTEYLIDIVKEALNKYVKKKEKNINKLIDYAKITGVYSITKKYFEVLL